MTDRRLPETPLLTVDVILELPGGRIVLIERKNPPHGWAIPGGFVDRGESCEDAARREVMEETGLAVENLRLLGVYSDPGRDPRFHTCSVVYTGIAVGTPRAGDDAAGCASFELGNLPAPLAFDHGRILSDHLHARRDRSGPDRSRSFGIVVVDDSVAPREFLLLKKRGRDVWELPKGRAEGDEDAERAARREVAEETGLAGLELLPVLRAVCRYERKPGGGYKDVVYFAARLPPARRGEVAISSEHEAFAWHSAVSARPLISREGIRGALDVVERYLDGEAAGARC